MEPCIQEFGEPRRYAERAYLLRRQRITACFRRNRAYNLTEALHVIRVTILATMLTSLSFAQELGLEQYLQRLKTAPGTTIAQKIEFLSGMGVKLSSQGMRDLNAAASGSTNTPFTPPRPSSNWSQNDFSAGWNSTTTRPGQWTNYNLDNGVTGNSNRIGNHTYYNFSNGVTGTNTDIGNHSYQNFNNGLNGNTTRIGSHTYQNWNNGTSGNSNRVGNTTYHNFGNGVTGNSTQVGNTTYHNFSDGRRCTTTHIGNQSNTRCQ